MANRKKSKARFAQGQRNFAYSLRMLGFTTWFLAGGKLVIVAFNTLYVSNKAGVSLSLERNRADSYMITLRKAITWFRLMGITVVHTLVGLRQ